MLLGPGPSVHYCYGKTRVDARLQTVATQCRYGGERLWFICQSCLQRVARLYLGAGLACRLCLRLIYPSQRKNALRRAWAEQRKIELQLATAGEWNGRERPKGMHWQTFAKLTARLRELEHERNLALVLKAQQEGLIGFLGIEKTIEIQRGQPLQDFAYVTGLDP